MSIKPKKMKELQKQAEPVKSEGPKKGLDLQTAGGIFFILLYAFGVYTNIVSGNYLMALVWTALIGINLFFIIRNRRLK